MIALCSTHGEVEAKVTRNGAGKITARTCSCGLVCKTKPRKRAKSKSEAKRLAVLAGMPMHEAGLDE